MDDELTMGMRDGGDYGEEEAHAVAHGELLLRAVLVDATAFDIFEREIGRAVGSGTRIHEARDVRVRQAGEQMALAAKAVGEPGGGDRGTDELDRTASLEAAVA